MKMWFCIVAMIFCAVQAGFGAATPTGEAAPVFAGPVRLLLPKVIYAVPGIEINVYLDNVVLVINPRNYAFDVTCAKGVQQAERWTFTPKADEVGEYPFMIEVRDQENKIIARARSVVRVVATSAGAGRPLTQLCIGDSLTHASVYTGHLLDLCGKPGNPNLTLIGSHHVAGQPEANRHEGYGGWTAERFVTHYASIARTGDYAVRGSPFLYLGPDGKPKLDFGRYCQEFNHGRAPDVVTILLGCNDTFHSDEEGLTAAIDRMIKNYDQLIAMIHGYNKDTKIGALLLVPPAASQDAFGANYGCGQTRWQYKRNQQEVVRRMLEHYGDRERENLWLIPANVNLDCEHNYPQATGPANARTGLKVTRQNNGVHPSADGYRQIGDSIYCWLKAQLAK